jgi:hypothetical protein
VVIGETRKRLVHTTYQVWIIEDYCIRHIVGYSSSPVTSSSLVSELIIVLELSICVCVVLLLFDFNIISDGSIFVVMGLFVLFEGGNDRIGEMFSNNMDVIV